MNLYALIPVGPTHAIPKRDLASIIGVDERVLRNMVHHERRAGRIILTDCASGGYFRPESTNQTVRFIRSMRHRAAETNRIADAVERAMLDEIGQSRIEGW